ncbi:MAG: hypothetical protein JSU07_03150 [Bacteroidetes bacterium]|nr:hypothetical protein [Bacteroidota bacterium]
MDFGKLKYCINLLLIFTIIINKADAQYEHVKFDAVITKCFDWNLKPVNVLKEKKRIIFVSSVNCKACVDYFLRKSNLFTFVFLLPSESLLEIKKLTKQFQLKDDHVFFTTIDYVKNKEFCVNPTPCFFQICENKSLFYNYNNLSKVTLDFSLPIKKFLKKTKLQTTSK